MTNDEHTEHLDAVEARLEQWIEDEFRTFQRELIDADRAAFGCVGHASSAPAERDAVSSAA
ncbi:MAG: hypothetical protein JWN46_3860 [Acidimicrobiales bacterium]|nr:hypothetical protein [Acidimicrobiales bacterium]